VRLTLREVSRKTAAAPAAGTAPSVDTKPAELQKQPAVAGKPVSKETRVGSADAETAGEAMPGAAAEAGGIAAAGEQADEEFQ
jgi:hypothetical protein